MHTYRPTARFYALLIALILIVFGVSIGIARTRLSKELDLLGQARAEYAQLELKCAQLQSDVSFVQTDAYVERAAREELGWLYGNEIRYTTLTGRE